MTEEHDAITSNDSTDTQTFTGINPLCPDCETKLILSYGEIVVSGKNDESARVPAHCPTEDCEWSGTAAYRMIRLDPY